MLDFENYIENNFWLTCCCKIVATNSFFRFKLIIYVCIARDLEILKKEFLNNIQISITKYRKQ